MQNVIWVPEFKVDSLIKTAKTLIKRAKLIEAHIPTIEVTKETKVESTKSRSSQGLLQHTLRQIRFVKVILSGEAPVLDDWIPIAKLTHKKYEDGYRNIITSLTTNEDDINYIDIDSSAYGPDCAHCGHKRYRKTTFLLKNKISHEVCQIGSTCLNDFTRLSSLKDLLNYFKIIDTFMLYNENNYSFSDTTLSSTNIPLETMVRTVMAVIQKYIYISRYHANQYDRQATADVIYDLFEHPELIANKELTAHVHDYITNETQDISEVMHYFTHTLPHEKNNKFALKLLPIIARKAVNIESISELSIFTGAVGGFYKRKAMEEKKIVEKKSKVDEYVGAVDANIELDLTLKSRKVTGSVFNGVEVSSNLLYFTDSKGRTLKAFSSAKFTNDIEINETYKIKAIIKTHEIYNGNHETVISRIKLAK